MHRIGALGGLGLLALAASCTALKPNDADDGGAGDAAASDATMSADVVDAGPFDGTHLQLWLRADTGLQCVDTDGGVRRAVRWIDGSRNHRDATLSGHMGPQCDVHSVAGMSVPYFSPLDSPTSNIEGTFDVDLSFLAGASYTLFIVERRWRDRVQPANGILIGTRAPHESLVANCNMSGIPNTGLHVGYGYPSGEMPAAFFAEQTCFGVDSPSTSATYFAQAPPVAFTIDEVLQDTTAYYRAWKNARQMYSVNLAGQPLVVAMGGSIGRGLLSQTRDTRFDGDIAEVIVFDAALDAAARTTVRAYLQTKWAVVF